mmetsp:Transcript_7819/g.28914  ORF Transcript_7819/g.28914 Transcript_7819/m.28914 type:complete len:122 (+) Transcript_7819:1726-2091(+)
MKRVLLTGRSRAGATVREALAFQHPLNHGCDGRTYPDNMMSHVFCWVPRGDNPTGRRLFDALAAGCIPVVLSDFVSSELPFKWKVVLFCHLRSYRNRGGCCHCYLCDRQLLVMTSCGLRNP